MRRRLLTGAAYALILTGTAAAAQSGQRQTYGIAAQDLGVALKELARQSGKEVVFAAAAVEGKRTAPLRGSFTLEQAVDRMLRGTGLVARYDNGGILIEGRAQASGEVDDRPTENDGIVVTGSRIAGPTPISPTIVLKQREIADAGFSNLGDLIRSIPQNYSGGQNPTVAGGGNQGGTNQNTTSSSTLNLRGLGPDATLTLLNGHRLPYDAVAQGVDISAIPLAAIDRIEIVTDGASAIYGSDAVAGVANIILKRSFEGVQTSARFGLSTDGGNEQQQYSLAAGTDWQSGGFLVTGDFSRSTAILAGDRKVTRTLHPTATLVPKLKQYTTILSGYQELGSAARLEIDATYMRRESRLQLASSTTASYLTNGATAEPKISSFSVSPSLAIDVAPGWEAYLEGTYGESRTGVQTRLYSAGALALTALVDYNNILKTGEAGITGSLASLPGGTLRVALGGGYRSNTLDLFTRSITGGTLRVSGDFARARDSRYGFAEVRAPLIEPENSTPLIHRLTLSGAVRYEHYDVLGGVATPKFGILYSPVRDLDLKASWGRSFKSPTLYQEFQYKSVALRLATAYGTSTFPAGSTVLHLSGGNPDGLQPERAENLTLALAWRPGFLPGAIIDASYFDVAYKDRIVAPISSTLGLFADPVYAHLITRTPTPEQIAAALANAPTGLSNQAGVPFDASRVVAIVDNRQRNSSRQAIKGIDLSLRYAFGVGATGTLTLLGSGSYIESEQVLVAGQPTVQLAGTIFRAPHWRARGGVSWQEGGLTVTSYLNYVGGTEDRRVSPFVDVGSFTTLDAAITYRVEAQGSPFHRLELSLAASNLLNAPPDTIRNSLATDPTYDSTNYSPVGRFFSFTIRKQW
ncbi:TonB-dependent receptor [Sphingomonas sp. MG17]|uniref:TonB-dependent receptor n=1 Tax=Sphingomonas tagetis TaxID=2949092 RepID=A0A9X2HRH1_9SPHN|nr:TonB-dependent receptor [Sphingomonas tagetis]MCP3732168.1 TonB-dependent receptor [Sphingomonas tagetis]